MISCSVNVETTMNLSNYKHSANEIRGFCYVTIIFGASFYYYYDTDGCYLGNPLLITR